MDFSKEIIAKAKETNSVGELMDLAKENGTELSEEEAKNYFDQLHPKTGELSDDELDNVAGGGCYSKDGYLKTTIGYGCEYFEKSQKKGEVGIKGTCCACKYWDHAARIGYEEVGRPVRCLNPNNMKKS